MNTLIILFAAINILLSNPKVQANPVLYQEVQQISASANQLADEYTSIQAQNITVNPAPEAIGSPDLSSVSTPIEVPAPQIMATTTMCTYVVPGRGSMPMACEEIRICELMHNCPIVPVQ